MDLNTFGSDLIKHISRVANSLEAIEMHVKGSKPGASAGTSADKSASKSSAKDKPAAPAKPKHDRAEVDKALITLKDQSSKEEAVAVYKNFGYAKMADIQEKDFDAVYEAAVARLEELKAEAEQGEDL